MKFFVVLVAAVITFSGVYAQTSAADRLESEALAFLGNFVLRASNDFNSLKQGIGSRAGYYYDAFTSLKDEETAAIISLTTEGADIARKIINEVDKIIQTLKKISVK